MPADGGLAQKPEALTLAPPANIEAEQALLAAVLVNNAAYDRVADILRPEHFAQGVHGRIFAAIQKLIDGGSVANPVTLKRLFDQDEALAEIGGARYLARLATSVVTIVNAADYARTIADCWLARQLMAAGDQLMLEAAGVVQLRPAAEVLERHETALYEIAQGRGDKGAGVPVDAGAAADAAIAVAEEGYRNNGRVTGVPTGIAELDRLLHGLQRSHLIVLAGRPAMGKTLLADTIGVAAARSFCGDGDNRAVLIFELEMTAAELGTRRLAAISDIAADRIQRGRLSAEEFTRLIDAKERLARLPLFTIDQTGLSLTDIRSHARRLARKRRLGLVVVDHIGLVRPSAEARRNGETACVTETTLGLKALAKDLDVPVLALSQLNRDLEKREDKRPMLADLRQSGSIEQDADVVMFVYREEYYLERNKPAQRPGEKAEAFAARLADHDEAAHRARNRAEILIAKQRAGKGGRVECFFDGARGLFQNLDQGEMPL